MCHPIEYRNVDAALRFFRKYIRHITGPTMKGIQPKADQCAVFCKDDKGQSELIATIHVVDTMLIRKTSAIEKYKKGFSDLFIYSDLGKVKKQLGVWYEWSKDEVTGETINYHWKNGQNGELNH